MLYFELQQIIDICKSPLSLILESGMNAFWTMFYTVRQEPLQQRLSLTDPFCSEIKLFHKCNSNIHCVVDVM